MKVASRTMWFVFAAFVIGSGAMMFLLVDETTSTLDDVRGGVKHEEHMPLVAVEVAPRAPIALPGPAVEERAMDAIATVSVSFLWPDAASVVEPAHEVRLVEGAWSRAADGQLEVPASAETLVAELRLGALSLGRVVTPAAEHLTFDLREHPAIRGRVVGWSGPIAAATVTATVPGRHRFTTTTGPGGDFFFAGLPADEHYELAAHADGWSNWSADFVVAEPPSAGVRHEIELKESGAIAGRVVDAAGAAVDRAIVSVVDRGWDRSVSTSADGAFRLDDIVEWPATVTVQRGEELIGWASVADVPRRPIEIVARPVEFLDGRVEWDDGAPAMLMLIATPLDALGGDLPAHAQPVLMRFTGSHGDGSFRVRDLVSDRVRLESDSQLGYSAVHSTSEPIVITLPRVQEFELRVQPAGSVPPPKLTFDLRAGRSHGTRTAGLDDGHYTIRSSAPRDAEVVVSIASAGGVLTEVTRGTATQLDGLVVEARPPSGRRVTFRVVDERGDPLRGAKLAPMWPVSSLESSLARHIASDSPFPGFRAATAVLRTNERGEASVEMPGEVPIELRATLDGYRAFRQRFEPGAVPAVVLEPAKGVVVIPSDGSRPR